ncbi:MAG: T9SS type A sorting domain-containing protein [Bacteroidetes bacterium]|nr:T9SS type A sorting domain-containing protein [Bacteroidota bacterium]
MKKFLLICLLMLFFNGLSVGQSYQKFINDQLFWDVAVAEMGYICGPYSDFGPWRYKFNGDTIINNTNYSKIIGFEHFSINHPSPPKCEPFYVDTISTYIPLIFLREDTINRKVYRYDSYLDLETLWYDFNAEQGDTIIYPNYGPFIVDTVFDIITNDGVNRKYFEYYGEWGGFYIEGLGGVGGLFNEPFYYFEAGPWLMCVKDHQGQIIWGTDCYDFTTNISSPVSSNPLFKAYPNPAQSTITIELPAQPSNNTNLTILNTNGQQLINQPISEPQTEISHLPTGIYIVKVWNDKDVMVQKVVKQ